MYGELTFLQSKLHTILNAIANGVKLSRLALDQDKSRLPTQPGKEESLEDVVCYLILLALDGDGLGGDRWLTETPRTLQVLNSDTRLRTIGIVLRARGCAEDKTTKEKGLATLDLGPLGSSLEHEAAPRTRLPKRRATAHCLIFIRLIH